MRYPLEGLFYADENPSTNLPPVKNLTGDQPHFCVEKANKRNNQQLQGFLSKLSAFILFRNL